MNTLSIENPHRAMKADSLETQWIELSELSMALGLHKRTIKRLREAGVLRATVLGGRLYFKRSEVMTALEDQFEVRNLKTPNNHGNT